jgi:hypothetical protein
LKLKYCLDRQSTLLMESDRIPEVKKKELTDLYLTLNPVELKRAIEKKLSNISKLSKQINKQS